MLRSAASPSLPPLAALLALGLLLAAVPPGGASRSPSPPPDEPLPYLDTTLPFETRAVDLVSRMTLAEKVAQMTNDAPAIDRLGVPEYDWWSEGLHGVARAGLATVFPQAIGLAATWDEPLMNRVATAISDEARAKHHDAARRGKRGIYQGLTFWSPNINLFRDPRWGRGMETYGEDPYLSGRMAVQFVRGMQGDDPRYLKVVATAKHYAVHSGPESDRHTFDAVTDARDLRETYLPQFEAAVREGGAWSVMCAYNRYLGKPCCASPFLLAEILRREWGFPGYVVSDCGAIDDIWRTHKFAATEPEAAAVAVKAGTDLSCLPTYKSLVEAVRRGLIGTWQIDPSLVRLFTARMKLGMFDPPEKVAYARIPMSVVDSAAHRELALETARKSIVLLKNDGGLLPLAKGLRRIAVVGPNADDVPVLLGNYNGTPADPVTPLRGIREKAAAWGGKVRYAAGSGWAKELPLLRVVPASALFQSADPGAKPGMKAEYFDSREMKGAPVLDRIEATIDANWWDRSPDPRLDDDDFGVRWTGVLRPPVTGRYAIGGEGFNTFKVWVGDTLVREFDGWHEPAQTAGWIELEAGKSYPLRVDFGHRSSDARMTLLWAVPGADPLAEAVAAALEAEAVIVFAGLSPRLEGEEMDVPVPGFKGGDRLTLDLPAAQQTLLEAVKKAAGTKPVVLVLLNGSALSVNWAAENIPAIVEAWYPGQAAGTAIADVLFGDANPSGRLPVTFYRSVDDLPPFTEYRMVGQTYRYFRGRPLFPFGHGLSYTRFEYADLRVPAAVKAGDDVPVTATVRNAGTAAGEEVVELYVRDVEASVPVPVRSLQGFRRVFLRPGESATVSFTVTARQMSLFDAGMKRIVEPGVFEISVGGKQPGMSGLADAATTGVVTGRVEATGPAKPV